MLVSTTISVLFVQYSPTLLCRILPKRCFSQTAVERAHTMDDPPSHHLIAHILSTTYAHIEGDCRLKPQSLCPSDDRSKGALVRAIRTLRSNLATHTANAPFTARAPVLMHATHRFWRGSADTAKYHPRHQRNRQCCERSVRHARGPTPCYSLQSYPERRLY